MKPSAPRSSFWSILLVPLVTLALAGCGHTIVKRPASSLTPLDLAALDNYEQLRAALAADDAREAHHAAINLAATLKPGDDKASPSPWLDPAQAVVAAQGIDGMRQRFKTLSEQIIPTVQGVDGYYVMTCDLPSAGDWVQRNTEVDDPYLGLAMHSLGNLKK